MSFALFLAVSLHAGLILGVGFSFSAYVEGQPTIEVTLAQHNDLEAPEDADFLAQANQLGSGDADEVKETTTPEVADFHDNVFRDVLAQPPSLQAVTNTDRATLTSVSASEAQAATEEPVEPTDAPTTFETPDFANAATEIASLDARLDSELSTDARRPRIRRLTSVSARAAEDAYYLQSWRRKVEMIGNLNYPEEARTRKLYGSLRLLVSITPDGGLRDVRVLDSSGHKVLDDAAVRIVRLAAPYAPFPPQMRKNTDVLEIIRTWQFRKNKYSSSS